jgi:hypothetical protein
VHCNFSTGEVVASDARSPLLWNHQKCTAILAQTKWLRVMLDAAPWDRRKCTATDEAIKRLIAGGVKKKTKVAPIIN